MNANVALENGDYGPRAVLKSAWSESIGRFLREKPIAELELNHAKGWNGNDLSFLIAFPKLHAFKILDLRISNVDPIHSLSELRSLGVTTYCKTELRFSAFPKLEACGLEWRSKATSLFECKTLRSLFVNRYKGKDTDSFARLTNLESLSILNAPIQNLNGLTGLAKLRKLRLAGLRKLASLGGIETLSELEELKVHTCRSIESIEPLASLFNLRTLDLNNDGEIISLKPLVKLNKLERVGFYETTNILDGNLEPLLALTKLSRLAFKNRKHYSHRREEFKAYNSPSS